MKKSFYIKFMQGLYTVLCIAMLGSMLSFCICAETLKNYSVTVDDPVGVTSQGMPAVLKNVQNGTNPELFVSGWIKSDETIRLYEYTIDGGKTWKSSTKAVKERPDVKNYCPNTYKTAGFELSIDVSDLPRGTYDFFLRAYTDQNDVIEVLAILNISIGNNDLETMAYREINLSAFGAINNVLTLYAGNALTLDAYSLREYQSFEVILDKESELTIKNQESFALSFERKLTTEQSEDGTYIATVSLTDVQYAGALILESTQDVQIFRMRFYTNVPDYYQGELRIRMTATPYEYLSGANAADAAIMSDQTVGTYMRLFPTTNTNDPYIYFNLNKYLNETQNGAQISADHYRYMVMTLQTPSTNSSGLFRLFLCAGEIRGPHGESHVAFQPVNDGKWHKYVIDLGEEEHWTGTVYGMRFDFIDSNAIPSDYANIAGIEFYPDIDSANEAAQKPFEVYYEQGAEQENIYKEEGRAPSGKADAITWFDDSLSDCFTNQNKTNFSFDEYGHLLLQATETFNDPFISFDLKAYAAKMGFSTLRAEDYGVIVLRILADKKINGKGFTLYYYSGGMNFAQGERAISAAYDGGEWEYLVYQMEGKNAWTDEILGMRLDFASQISAGQKVCISDMLFFKDMSAWEEYAKQNGIEIPSNEPPIIEIETETPAPETEMPTIEIPTAGPGLEYIPPEQTENSENTASCQSVIFAPLGMFLSLAAVMLIKTKNKKGDQS